MNVSLTALVSVPSRSDDSQRRWQSVSSSYYWVHLQTVCRSQRLWMVTTVNQSQSSNRHRHEAWLGIMRTERLTQTCTLCGKSWSPRSVRTSHEDVDRYRAPTRGAGSPTLVTVEMGHGTFPHESWSIFHLWGAQRVKRVGIPAVSVISVVVLELQSTRRMKKWLAEMCR